VSKTPEWLVRAESLRASGRLAEAEQCCRQALEAEPTNTSARHLWENLQAALAMQDFQRGMACAASGRHDEAAACFQRAVERKADYLAAQSNLGVALQLQGRFSEAAAAFRRAIELAPRDAELHRKLAGALEELGARDEAVACCRRAVELRPDHAESQNSLGVLLERQDRLDEAVACLREAVRLAPDFADAHGNLAAALERQGKPEEASAALQRAVALAPNSARARMHLALALERQGKVDDAIASYRRAVQLEPRYPAAHPREALIIGLAALNAGRHADAADCLRRATLYEPDNAEAHNHLGVALLLLDKLGEAEAALRRAVALAPDYAEAHSNLGAVLDTQPVSADNVRQALACYHRAAELRPDSAKMRHNYGLALLRSGNFAEGWPQFEWRLRRDRPERQFAQPRWSGSDIAGKTILLWEDEGLGDSMQCVRYAQMLKARGARVIIECRRQLAGLLATCPGVDQVVIAGTLAPEFDVHLPLLSLPGVMGTTLDNIPANVPYLFADRELIDRWKEELGAGGAFSVGIAWQGDPRQPRDRYRSIPLASFAPLAAVSRVRLYSVQSGAGREHLAKPGAPRAIIDLGDRVGDFYNTAAVLTALDLVITCDSVLAHLAGALGLPVWVALAHFADWRWMLERADSPWYPTMRLYRQRRPGDWNEVFKRIAADLAATCA
jgi:tetratricopeptide (TPR) repeat protein